MKKTPTIQHSILLTFIFYYCVINDHKYSSLKQHKFIISRFPGPEALSPGSSDTSLNSRYLPGLQISPEACVPLPSSLLVSRSRFLANMQPGVALSFCDYSQFCNVALPYMAAHFFKANWSTSLQSTRVESDLRKCT